MLWVLVAILVVLWLAGLLMNVVGGTIHLLLLLAVLIAAYNLFIRPRRAS